MNRSAPSRLLLVLLAVLLQLALLPAGGRMPCMLRTASVSGCCCIVEQPAPAPICCAQADSTPAEEPSRIDDACSCPSEADELWTTPRLASSGSGAAKADVDDTHGALPSRPLCFARAVSSEQAVGFGGVPRSCTGPPLHLLFQVFLI